MTRLSNQVPANPAEQVRDELAAARAHLQAAAKHGAERLGDTSRRTRKIARERAAYTALALRGERPASPWRWLGIGLAAGVAAGAASVVVLRQLQRRSDRDLQEQAREATGTVREKASTTVDTVRDRAGAAAQRATAAARDTAAKVREATRGLSPTTAGSEPAAEPAGERSEPTSASPRRDTDSAGRQPSPASAGE